MVWHCKCKCSPNGVRTEILHNIDGLNGTGEAAIRVGDFKLLKNPTGTDVWCDTCLKPGGCQGSNNKTVLHGGEICCDDPVDGGDCEPKSPRPRQVQKDTYFLFNITADARETNDMSGTHPGVLQHMLARLAFYNQSNVPCCSCSSGAWADVVEMAQPPVDGYWTAFHNQTDWTHRSKTGRAQLDPNCALMHEPAP